MYLFSDNSYSKVINTTQTTSIDTVGILHSVIVEIQFRECNLNAMSLLHIYSRGHSELPSSHIQYCYT